MHAPTRRASQGTRRAPHGRDINHTDQHHRPEVRNTQRNRRAPPRRSTQVGPLHDHTEIGRFLYLGAAAVAMRHLGVCARSVHEQRAAGRPGGRHLPRGADHAGRIVGLHRAGIGRSQQERRGHLHLVLDPRRREPSWRTLRGQNLRSLKRRAR